MVAFSGDQFGFVRRRSEETASVQHDAEQIRDLDGATIADAWHRIATVVEKVAEKWLEKRDRRDASDQPVAVIAPKERFTPDEAGIEINRTANQVRELCRRRVFGTKDAGGKWWISKKEIEHFRLGRKKIHGEEF